MRIFKATLLSGAAAFALAAPASAADMPPPMVYKAPVVQTGGWYLRGDIGFSNQQVDELTNPAYTSSVSVLKKEVDSAPFGGLGFGYTFNNWFRVDVTGEYRGGATFRGLDSYPGGANDITGTKSEWLVLGNAYIDLGTWWCFTPFVGAGIGASRNTISNWRDVNVVPPAGAIAYADSHSQWEMAWAVHAGLAYKVTPNFTVEFAYRYTSLGDFATSDMIGYDGSNAVYNPYTLKDVTSHDFKLGLRWNLTPTETIAPVAMPAYAPPPAYNPPPPAYSPPPPLMRKG
jgi:opacity protein-like surface antigen